MPLAYIALGANLPSPAGPPEATLAAAVQRLASLGRIAARSSLYSTAPVGVADQPRFLNAVVALETRLAPRTISSPLSSPWSATSAAIRSASVPNGPRTLDLDILLYGDLILSEPGLEIPHPRIAQRAFVLVPLNEIAPDLRDPRSGLTAAQLLGALPGGCVSDVVAKIESNLWAARIVE